MLTGLLSAGISSPVYMYNAETLCLYCYGCAHMHASGLTSEKLLIYSGLHCFPGNIGSPHSSLPSTPHLGGNVFESMPCVSNLNRDFQLLTADEIDSHPGNDALPHSSSQKNPGDIWHRR